MDCQNFREAISALADGSLAPEARAPLDRHLAACPACRAEAADLRRIVSAASTLPPMAPPITLWPRLASRLRDEGARETRTHGLAGRALPDPVHDDRIGWPRRAGLAGWLTASPLRVASLAVAAMLLVAVGTSVVLFRPAPRTGQAPTSASTAAAPGAAGAASGAAAVNANSPELVQSVEQELRLAEQHYEKAITGLEQIAKSGEGALDPQVAATLRNNLGVIDQAISDSRVALAQQPGSQLAQESLFEAFRRKVALLQDTVALINEMRKGNQAGAARAIDNLGRS